LKKIEDIDFEDLIKKLRPDSDNKYTLTDLSALLDSLLGDDIDSICSWDVVGILRSFGYRYRYNYRDEWKH